MSFVEVRKEDRAKLAVLGVGLVFALGFVGKTVMSIVGSSQPVIKAKAKASKSKVASAADSVGTVDVLSVFTERPSPNDVDPFRVVLPKLTRGRTNVTPIKDISVTPLPAAGGFSGGGGKVAPLPVSGMTVRAEPAEPLTVNGTVKTDGGAALVTYGEKQDIISVGTSIGPYTLVAVGSNGATFRTKKGYLTVTVGQTHEERAEAPKGSTELPSVDGAQTFQLG